MPSSPAPATRLSALGLDLAPRVVHSSTVAASPAAATETVVCTVTVPAFVAVNYGVLLFGFGAFTIGASGTAYTLKLRQTGTSGTTLQSTGVLPLAAGVLGAKAIVGFDTSPVLPGQVYVLTATIANGAAETTFSAAELIAIVV